MNYAVYSASKDKKLYDDLKKSMSYVLTEPEQRDIEILSILEKLGYPMNHLGSYFLKDVIVEVVNIINSGVITSNNKRRQLVARLNDGYDDIYKHIASEDKEIGCKTFHSYIEGAIGEIDVVRSDTSLAQEIYVDNELSYGTVIYRIADYYVNSYNNDYKGVRIKKLNNTTDSIRQTLILK